MNQNKHKGFLLLLSLLPLYLLAANNGKYVNLFMGTSGDHGQVSPGAAVPFGMVCVSPDSDPKQHAGYDYAVTHTSGISVNRISGVGGSGAGGNISIRPATFGSKLERLPQTEQAIPGYYAVQFSNGVSFETTATHNVALERFEFPLNTQPLLAINFASTLEGKATCSYKLVNNKKIEGWVKAKNVVGRGWYTLWFSLTTNHPFEATQIDQERVELLFNPKEAKKLEVRVALSSIDEEHAHQENQLLANQTFNSVKQRAAKEWKRKLDKIEVTGGDEDLKQLFYTSLYRIYLSPANVTSHNKNYRATDNQLYKADGFTYYSCWSLWDTFRTKFPYLVLMEPKAMSDMAQSLVQLYRTGKENWSTPYEATPTVRTEHASILLLDAYRKGITGFDFNLAYEGLKKEMAELPMNSPDQKLEAAYDLWAMAQIAAIIERETEAADYKKQAESLFEKTWKEEFMNPTEAYKVMKKNGLYQGTRWQYRWAAPQYIEQMIEWVGKEKLATQLHYFFDNNLYNQGNEPDIHVPFLFNRFGQPVASQKIVRNLMTKEMVHLYGGNAEFKTPYFGKAFKNEPEGYMPEMDEDDGTMSAWFAFAAMGFYPLLVGSDSYELTSPLFDKIEIQINKGKRFVIETKGRKCIEDPIKEIKLNGEILPGYSLTHQAITAGGNLSFSY